MPIIVRYLPDMMMEFAEQAGIKVPQNAKDFDKKEYPHFFVYLICSLGYAYSDYQHELNAEVVAKIPEDKIQEVTPEDLEKLGFNFTVSDWVD